MIDRARLGKLFGAAGSAHEGERLAALRAIDLALQASGISWAWVAAAISNGEQPSDARAQLYDRLVRDRLAEGYAKAWALTTPERAIMGQVNAALAAGAAVRDVPIEDLVNAIEVADAVKRRDPAKGPARVNWR